MSSTGVPQTGSRGVYLNNSSGTSLIEHKQYIDK